jgi:hypothetical protein
MKCIILSWSWLSRRNLAMLQHISVFLSAPGSQLTRRREGRAIAQAVSRRLPTAAARVQTRVWSCGIL